MSQAQGAPQPEPNVGLAFGLNIAAGACTGLGALVVLLKYNVRPEYTGGVLGVSAGVMVFISFVDIFMSKSVDAFYEYAAADDGGGADAASDEDDASTRSFQFAMAAFFGGVALTLALDAVVHLIQRKFAVDPAQALGAAEVAQGNDPPPAEALSDDPALGTGECALTEAKAPSTRDRRTRLRLARSGAVAAAAIALHNLPEGIVTFVAALADARLGAALAVGVALHNIPEGAAVAVPIHQATGSAWKAVLVGTASGLTEPLGGLIAYFALSAARGGAGGGREEALAYAVLFGVVAGMMVTISVHELLPMALRCDAKNKLATKGFFLGMLIMALSLVLFTL